MFWGCFAASGTGCSESVQGTMKSQNYQGILERNVLLCQKAWAQSQVMGPPTR
jgi:hypothetical protein